MDDMVELRCKYCGAPLDRKDIESDSPYITCPSCGTTQQRLDARKYMEQMMGQIADDTLAYYRMLEEKKLIPRSVNAQAWVSSG